MLRLFLRFFGLEWSVAERKTEKSRRRIEEITANLRDGMPRDSYSRGCYADVFCYRKFLCSGTDPSLHLLLQHIFSEMSILWFSLVRICPFTRQSYFVFTFCIAFESMWQFESIQVEIASFSDQPCFQKGTMCGGSNLFKMPLHLCFCK